MRRWLQWNWSYTVCGSAGTAFPASAWQATCAVPTTTVLCILGFCLGSCAGPWHHRSLGHQPGYALLCRASDPVQVPGVSLHWPRCLAFVAVNYGFSVPCPLLHDSNGTSIICRCCRRSCRYGNGHDLRRAIYCSRCSRQHCRSDNWHDDWRAGSCCPIGCGCCGGC